MRGPTQGGLLLSVFVVVALILAHALPAGAEGLTVELSSPQSDDQGRYVPSPGPTGVTVYGLVSGGETVRAVTVNGVDAKLFSAEGAALGARERAQTVAFKAYLNLGPRETVRVRVRPDAGEAQVATFEPNGEATVKRLRALVAEKSGPAAAWRRLANALSDQGRLTEAASAYRRALKQNPKLVAAYVGLAETLRFRSISPARPMGQYAGGPLEPEDYGPHFHGGVTLCAETEMREAGVAQTERDRELLNDAIGLYRKAVELAPDDFEAQFGLGLALCDAKRPNEALPAYRKAVAIDPDDFEARFHLGCVLRRTGQLDEAIASQRKAIDLRPDFAPAHSCLSLALYAKGDYDAAWRQVHLTQKCGARVSPKFLEALRKKMPEP